MSLHIVGAHAANPKPHSNPAAGPDPHAGILKLAFETSSFANAEFRCFELSADGEIVGSR